MGRISARCSDKLQNDIELLAKILNYRHKSELIRYAMRRFIEAHSDRVRVPL